MKSLERPVRAMIAVATLALGGYAIGQHVGARRMEDAATHRMVETQNNLSSLGDTLAHARSALREGGPLLTEPELRAVQRTILRAETDFDTIDGRIDGVRSLFDGGDYSSVREALEPGFPLPEGVVQDNPNDHIAITRGNVADALNILSERKGIRDEVVSNERTLLERFRYQDISGVEEIVTNEKDYRRGPGLSNSLGAALRTHEWTVDHIRRFARTEDARNHGVELYNAAHDAYKRAPALRDALKAYRPEIHDGTFTLGDYTALRAQQGEILEVIAIGDRKLDSLDGLFAELHEQRVVFVSGHSDRSKTFSHTELNYDFIDGEFELETEHTEGKEFFYTLTTRWPDRQETAEIGVGEKDSDDRSSWRTWDYATDERVGYVRAWKRFHYPESALVSGMDISEVAFEKTDRCSNVGSPE